VRVFHGIEQDAARVCGEPGLAASVGPEVEHRAHATVGSRDVVPEKKRTPKRLRSASRLLRIDRRADHRPPGPCHLDLGIERLAELLEVGRGLGTEVVGGDEPERHVLAEPFPKVVGERNVSLGQRSESALILLVHQAGRHVIDGEREEAATQLAKTRKLVGQRGPVFTRRVADREPRRDGEAHLDPGRDPPLDELTELLDLRLRIGLAPTRTVERIALGGVDVEVHPPGPHPFDHPESILVGPGWTVVAFDDPAIAEGGHALRLARVRSGR
jgi:hypothetical protein